MYMVRVRTPDELRSLLPDMPIQKERQRADCFIRVWDMERTSEHPRYRGIEVLMQMGRDARLYYTVHGKSEFLGVVRLDAAKKFAMAHSARAAE